MEDSINNNMLHFKKIDILVEEYKRANSDMSIFLREILRTLLYGAILLALYLGIGLDLGSNSNSQKQIFREYLPYGFVVLIVYFLSLQYMRISLSRYLAGIEKRINAMLKDDVLCLDSWFVPNVQSEGRLRLGNKWYQNFPTPMGLLGIVIAFAVFAVFVLERTFNHRLALIVLFSLCGLIAIYVFFVLPKLLDKIIMRRFAGDSKDES